MDLIVKHNQNKALSNVSGQDLSATIIAYAETFFDTYKELDLFIGKDRSPSCGVRSARLYDEEKNLLSSEATGLMAIEAKKQNIDCIDAEDYKELV
jgi:uncharacterized protein YbbK (DUF523 family)